MNRASLSLALCLSTTFAACSGPDKQPVETDFSDLATLDQKSDAFSYRMKILGSLDYGQTSAEAAYTKKPRYRAYKFGGSAGDKVDVWVRSSDGGDAVAWLLDNAFKVVGSNDDADGNTLDAHITATLPGNTDPSIVTYYIVYRDYGLYSRSFSVSLAGKSPSDFYSCQSDADCVAVPAHGCCTHCADAAVNKDQVAAYKAQPLACGGHVCAQFCRLETRVAQCNRGTSQCEMIEIADISCGGFVANPHSCPPGYECNDPGAVHDAPGNCVAAPSQFCGGIANIQCPAGMSCVDDPNDSCDPTQGGADCGGICVTSASSSSL